MRHRYLPGRAFDVPRNVLDVARAERLLGWRPQVPLREGMAQLLAFMASHAPEAI